MGISRRELTDSAILTTRQNRTQIGDLVNEFVNLSISEINDPWWAFPRGSYNHLWNFLRRKTTLTTTSGTDEYVLPRDVDKIALVRQTETPTKLIQIPDEKFFELVPNPTDSGNPRWYRIWEVDGVATRLATADTIDVVSSSASDSGDSTLSLTVSGYDSNGIWRRETYQLNGTTDVTGSTTFAAREVYVSKQKDTTGSITVKENSGGTTLVILGPQERSASFRVMTLYPNPGSALTIYIEYYTRIPSLENDSEVPIFDEKWHYIIRLGVISKIYQYLNKETDYVTTQNLYASAVRAMVEADRYAPDLIEHMSPRDLVRPTVHLRRSEDAIS